jgi:hypothetical protein
MLPDPVGWVSEPDAEAGPGAETVIRDTMTGSQHSPFPSVLIQLGLPTLLQVTRVTALCWLQP